MDKYEITIQTFHKLAARYQEKYMDFEFYQDTYDLLNSLIALEDAEVLEIACGPGIISKYLLGKRPGLRIMGIDLAPAMVELAKRNLPNGVFQVMDCRDLSKLTQKFDVIVSGFCTPYISKEEVAQLIADVSALLRPSGIFYLSTMEGDYERSGFKASSTGDQAYVYYHNADWLIGELASHGLELVELRRKDFPEADGSATIDLFLLARAKAVT